MSHVWRAHRPLWHYNLRAGLRGSRGRETERESSPVCFMPISRAQSLVSRVLLLPCTSVLHTEGRLINADRYNK
jgi:hypothetical protein